MVEHLVAALVVKIPGAEVNKEELCELVAEKLTDYKRLRGGIFFLDEIPMTPSGKVRRKQARELAEKLLHSNL